MEPAEEEERARYLEAAHAETQVLSLSDEELEEGVELGVVGVVGVVGVAGLAGVEAAGVGLAGGVEAEAMAPGAHDGLMGIAGGHMTQVQANPNPSPDPSPSPNPSPSSSPNSNPNPKPNPNPSPSPYPTLPSWRRCRGAGRARSGRRRRPRSPGRFRGDLGEI